MATTNQLLAAVFAFFGRYSWPSYEQHLAWIRNDDETSLLAGYHSSVPFFESDATKNPGIHLHVLILLTTKLLLSRVTSGSVAQPRRDLRFDLVYLLGLTLR
jgi:hypothetical protein